MSANPVPAIHEPHCNIACRPGVHYLSSGVGLPHIHQTDLKAQCGQCLKDTTP